MGSAVKGQLIMKIDCTGAIDIKAYHVNYCADHFLIRLTESFQGFSKLYIPNLLTKFLLQKEQRDIISGSGGSIKYSSIQLKNNQNKSNTFLDVFLIFKISLYTTYLGYHRSSHDIIHNSYDSHPNALTLCTTFLLKKL